LNPTQIHAEGKPHSLEEIVMDPHQSQEIASDLPANGLGIDSKENAWFIGTHFLWKWTPERRTIEKITLASSRPLKHITVSEDLIFVSDDSQIFQIEMFPLKITSFPSSDKVSQSLGIIAEQSSVFWVKTDGLYELSKTEKSLHKIQEHNIVKEEEEQKFTYFPSTKTLWFTKDHELSYLSYGENKKAKKLGKIEKNIDDIQRVQDEVFGISRTAVYRYSKRGKLIQTIPVSSHRRIVLSTLLPNAHAYVFQDRLLEVQMPFDKKEFHFYLDIGRVHKASAMALRSSLLGLVLDGNPRIFQFSNTDWAS